MIRTALTVGIAAVANCALAQSAFGTKADNVASSPVTSSGPMALIQMLVALAIVFAAIKFLLPKLATKLSKKLVTNLHSAITIEESANFAGGTLYIVKAKTKTLLLSVGTSGVNCIADLSDTQPAKPEVATFGDILNTHAAVAPNSPAMFSEAVIEDDLPKDPVVIEAKSILDRLSRFTA
mgnify:CR=1 FL=1